VDALVRAIVKEQRFPAALPVVATGGLASVVAAASETITAVDEALTVRGIRRVFAAAGASGALKKRRGTNL
jgi:type III pantothenate kinase